MRTIDDYLDIAKIDLKLGSDRAVAKAIKVTSATLTAWRMKRQWPSDEAAARLARLIGIPEEQMLLDLNAWRAKSGEIQQHYVRAADAYTKEWLPLGDRGVQLVRDPKGRVCFQEVPKPGEENRSFPLISKRILEVFRAGAITLILALLPLAQAGTNPAQGNTHNGQAVYYG